MTQNKRNSKYPTPEGKTEKEGEKIVEGKA